MSSEDHPFTDRLWEAGAPWYQRILAHPFMEGLQSGELTTDRFAYYLVQDYHFLQLAGQAFSIAASKAHNDSWILAFNRCSTEVLRVERSLHHQFFQELNLTPQVIQRTALAPTNEAYSNFVLTTAHQEGFPEALCALLPCFWLYRDLGQEVLARAPRSSLCRQWAEFYGGETYDEMIEKVLDLVDTVGEEVDGPTSDRMLARFAHSCRYEWMFWEMSFRKEQWPFP